MEQKKLALSAVMIVAVGLIGTNFVTGLEMTEQKGFDTDIGTIYGHITLIHSDPDGNVLAYVQTDNLVANIGKDCMAELVFGAFDAGDCESSGTFVFNNIALYDGASFPVTMNATGLTTATNNDGVNKIVTASGLGIADGASSTTTLSTPAATDASTNRYIDGVGGITDIEKLFTATGDFTGQNVDGAALLNSNTDAVLVGQEFPFVTIDTQDTLKITWNITIG